MCRVDREKLEKLPTFEDYNTSATKYVCVCVYIYMCIYIHIYIYAHTHTHTYIYILVGPVAQSV
jgi:hypothetical protein